MPRSASSVEDRSLRKISSEGTAVRSPPRQSFQTRFFRNVCLTVTQQSDGFFHPRNLDQEKLLRRSLLGEKERSLNKSAYDELASLLYYATLQHDSSNLSNNQLSQINLRRIVEALIGRRPSDNGRPTQTRAGRRTIGEQDRA